MKKNRTRNMETWNRPIAVGGEEGEWEWWKEGEGTTQRTCMNDSWTWTVVRELTLGEKGGLGGWEQKGKKKEFGATVIE